MNTDNKEDLTELFGIGKKEYTRWCLGIKANLGMLDLVKLKNAVYDIIVNHKGVYNITKETNSFTLSRKYGCGFGVAFEFTCTDKVKKEIEDDVNSIPCIRVARDGADILALTELETQGNEISRRTQWIPIDFYVNIKEGIEDTATAMTGALSKKVNESLHGKKEIDEFFKLCNELGLKTFGDLERFADDNKNRIIVNRLLSKYDSSMSADAFFQTLKDYKKEEFGDHFQAIPDDQAPEFKYDDPLRVAKHLKTESYVDEGHTYYAVLSENNPELVGMVVPIIAWDNDNDEYFDFFYADAPGLVDGVDKFDTVEEAKERAKEIMEANWQTFGENEWPVLYIGKFDSKDTLVEFVDEVREFAEN